MFAFATLAAVASAALPQVLAHGGVLAYSNAGNWYQGWCVLSPVLATYVHPEHRIPGLRTTAPLVRPALRGHGPLSMCLFGSLCMSPTQFDTAPLTATRSLTQPTRVSLAMTTVKLVLSNSPQQSLLDPQSQLTGTKSGLMLTAPWFVLNTFAETPGTDSQ